MKRLLAVAPFALVAALTVVAGPVHAADVGVSVNIGLPGAYGRVDIGGYPQPQLLYPQPVYVQREPSRAPPPPIYLHVPPGHAKNWRRHCAEYNACGQPVYFVQDNWYRDVYAPRYQEMQRRGPDRRDDRRDDRGPRGRDDHGDHGDRHDDRGNGRGGRDGHDDRDGRGRN